MIDPKELRIGNYIKNGRIEEWVVLPADIGLLDVINTEDCEDWEKEIYKPIPLTPEWLERFGFVKPEEDWDYITNTRVINPRPLEPELKGDLCFIIWGDMTIEAYILYDGDPDGTLIAKPEYVHQLQNLYFALTGEELTQKMRSTKLILQEIADVIKQSKEDRDEIKTVLERLEQLSPVDNPELEKGIKAILDHFDDYGREGLVDTPKRYIQFLDEFLNPPQFKFTSFESEGYDEMIIQKDIQFYSLCEHHLAPFFGVAHVAYIPDKKIVGLSKLARTVELYSRRFQNQERITALIAERLTHELAPHGVAVVLEAEHLCMTMRGVKKRGTTTMTSKLMGQFKTDLNTRQEFLNLLKH